MSAPRYPLNPRRHSCLFLLAFALLLPTPATAQVVSSATGQIDLLLRAFFENDPDQILAEPVGLFDASASIDGSGYTSAGGLSEADFNYFTNGPAQTWFTTYTDAQSEDAANGGGGHANLDISFFVPVPIYYRLEADALDSYLLSYNVEFNGVTGSAYYDYAGVHGGTFPLLWHNDDPNTMTIGWDTYVDEGFLPAGLYDLSIRCMSNLNRYGDGDGSTGVTSLLIQMQGDTNLDGVVGIEDLNTVLANWNEYVPTGVPQFGDLSRDGIVGVEDLNQVLSNWNSSVLPPSIAVPEPMTGMVLGMVSLGLLRRRQR